MTRWQVPDALYPTDNQYGIPVLQLHRQALSVDMPLVTWGSVSRRDTMRGTWHFYTDDYRFTALLSRPESLLDTGCISAIEPNLSINPDTPRAVVLYRIYQKRWIARYWQAHGIRLIVDLNVTAPHAAYNLLGVPRGWQSYATRGHAAHLPALEREYQLATQHAGGTPELFIVYGGGRPVRDYCYQHAMTYIVEYIDQLGDTTR